MNYFGTEYGQLILSGSIVCTAVWGLWFAFNAGAFLMGQAAVMGVAAYGAAYAMNHWGLSYPGAAAFGVVLGGVLGIVLGLLKARLGGIYFGMASLGLSSLFVVVVDAIPALGGPLGIAVTYIPSAGELLALFGVAFVFVVALSRSKMFRRFRSVGDDSAGAAACGVSVTRESILSLGIAGVLGGLAGVAYMFNLGSVTPDQFSLSLLVELLVALIAGGLGTVFGPVIGSAIVVLIPYLSGENPDVVYGLAILIVVIAMPVGLVPRYPRKGDINSQFTRARSVFIRRTSVTPGVDNRSAQDEQISRTH